MPQSSFNSCILGAFTIHIDKQPDPDKLSVESESKSDAEVMAEEICVCRKVCVVKRQASFN